jgi:hypothetical protein
MILIIGGRAQGKRTFARKLLGRSETDIADGGSVGFEEAFSRPILNDLHLLIKRLREAGYDPLDFVAKALAEKEAENKMPEALICEEVANAVIPLAAEDSRTYRSRLAESSVFWPGKRKAFTGCYCAIPFPIKGGGKSAERGEKNGI